MATSYARVDSFVTNALSNALSGNLVYILTNQVGATPATVDLTQLASIFTSSTGATAAANPQTTDGYGHAAAYILQGNYTIAWVSPTGTILQVFPDQAVFTGGTTTAPIINATTGFQFNSAAPLNHTLIGNGTYYVDGLLNFNQLGGSIALGQTPLTTAGDLFSVTSGALSRVPVGAPGQFLGVAAPPSAALPFWLNVTWNNLANAAANLTLNNAGFETIIQQLSTDFWTFENATAATLATPQSSPSFQWQGNYWTGSASSPDTWTVQNVIGTGTNGTSTLTITHSGTTLGALTISTNASIAASGTIKPGSFTVATLPVGVEGQIAYATNGRKVGEIAGFGSGVPVYYSADSGGSPPTPAGWHVFSTDALVTS